MIVGGGWIITSPSSGGMCSRRTARSCAVSFGGLTQAMCCCGCCCGFCGLCPACSRYMPARMCRCQAGCCSCAKSGSPKRIDDDGDDTQNGMQMADGSSKLRDCSGLLCIFADPYPVSSRELVSNGEELLLEHLSRSSRFHDMIANSSLMHGGAHHLHEKLRVAYQ